jgi:hypothetical protein
LRLAGLGFAGAFAGALLGTLLTLAVPSSLGIILDLMLLYGLLGLALAEPGHRGRASAAGLLLGLVPGVGEVFFRSPAFQAYGYRLGLAGLLARVGLHLIGGVAAGAAGGGSDRLRRGIAVGLPFAVAPYFILVAVKSIPMLAYLQSDPHGNMALFLVLDAASVGVAGALSGAALGLLSKGSPAAAA